MELKQLLNDDRGVSPVIGVILMVAITVILAAVIGTFVLGLGGQVGNNAPSATFEYDYSSFDDSSGTAEISVTSQGGDPIDPANVDISVPTTDGSTSLATNDADAGNTADDGEIGIVTPWSDPVQAGDTLTVADNTSDSASDIAGGEEVQLIWSSDGGSTSIISSSTTPATTESSGGDTPATTTPDDDDT